MPVFQVEEVQTPEPVILASQNAVLPQPEHSESVVEILKQYDWNAEIAHAVMLAESGGNAKALNDNPATQDYSVGLFQINLYGDLAHNRPSEEWLRVPENNIAYAYEMWRSSGWKPWSVYNSGSYLKFLY